MSFRQSLVRLAEHARTPLIRFPDRKAKPRRARPKDDLGADRRSARRPHRTPQGHRADPPALLSTLAYDTDAHSPTAHPCAPQSVIDAFPRFQDAQANPTLVRSASSSYGGSPNVGAGTGAAQGSASGASASAQSVGAESELPSWLRRSRWAPAEDEIEAVMSGGASVTPEITKAYQQRWYTPQF
ncbi:hypothetical protein JCM3770_003171 [Rhodotorula araucariae]